MALFALLAAFACLASPLAAQDVIVMPPALFDLPDVSGQPDTPPGLRKEWEIPFPSRQQATTMHNYVIVTQYTARGGRNQFLHTAGSGVPYEESVSAKRSDLQCAPAQTKGMNVAGFSWIGVIFNPAGAGEGGAESSPRLLKVAPIIATQKQLDDFPKKEKAPRGPRVIRGTVEVDADGAAKNLKLETNASYARAVRPAIERSLKQWQFAPARKDERPVKATLALDFVIQTAPDFKTKASNISKMPKVIKQEAPIYPFAMKRSNMVGEVTMRFLVSPDGNVHSPAVVRSNNPHFEQPAIDAILKWEFEPGFKDGLPVTTAMQIPIQFDLGLNNSKEAFSARQPSKKQTAEMPEGLRYDTAPEPLGVIFPVYPYELLRDGKKGEATVGVLVSARGVVAQIAIINETAPEFGQAVLAACEYFQFKPALLDGQPTDAVARIKLEFNSNSSFATSADRDMLRLEKKSPEKIVGSKNLDAVPKPIVKRDAPFPLAASLAGVTEGEAVVEFLIDTEGRVRLPRIVSGTHPSFGYMAVQTVANWRFEPPKAQGKPVVTRARIPVVFGRGGSSRK